MEGNEDDDLFEAIQEDELRENTSIGKRGRAAKLNRSEVNHIRHNINVPAEELALIYGVSKATIYRARNHFYATKAEDGAHSYIRKGRGRKLANGTNLTEEMKQRIADDPSPALVVAQTYGVSVPYVYKLRQGSTTERKRRGPLPQEVMDEICSSDRDDEAIARLLHISVNVVRFVRANYG